MKFSTWFIVSFAALQLTAPSVGAQGSSQDPESSYKLEEILVTARKVEESLQTIPLSVSAFRAEDLEKLNIERIGDTAAFTPNFAVIAGPTGHNDGFFFIRGIGQTDLSAATDPGVGTYIDGVYLGRLIGASFDSLDIERIEVLRGPQGTLFGRNTMGGAVSVVTHDPGDKLQGKIALAGGQRSLASAKVNVDIPLLSDLAVSLSALYKTQDGWSKSVVNGKTFDDVDDRAVRAKFLWEPTENFTARLVGDWTQGRGTSQSQILAGVNIPSASPLGVPLPSQIADDLSTNAFQNRSSILDPRYDLDSSGASLTLDWDLGAASLKSISAYRELDQEATSDFDGSQINFYQSLLATREHQLSQEFQLTGRSGRLKWLLGANYFKENASHNNSISLGGNNGCLPVPPVAIPPTNPYPSCFVTGQEYATPLVDRVLTNNQRINVDIEAVAAFAHATFQITDAWSASLGLRWTDEQKTQAYDYFIDNTDGVANFAGLPPIRFPTFSPDNPFVGVPTTYRKSWSDITPKLGVEYRASDSVLWYASYAEGFKSGGFNGRVSPNNQGQFPVVQPYNPEQLKTVELGWKSQLAEDRVRLNGSVFASRYEQIQLLVLDAESGFFENQNAAEAELYGLELDLEARATEALEVNASLGYLHHEYTKLNPETLASGITKQSKLPGTPEWTGSLGAQYTWNLRDSGALSVRSDYTYRSKVFFNAVNGALENGDDLGLMSARANYLFPGDRLSVSAYVLNLTDEEYVSNGQDVTAALGVAFNSIGAPREWGVEMSYRFGE